MRLALFIAVGLVGWAMAMVGIATNDAVLVFLGVAVVTIAAVRGFLTLERGAGDPSPTAPRVPSSVRIAATPRRRRRRPSALRSRRKDPRSPGP